MDLARIAVKLRPRSPWEGIDLGFMLGREWFFQLWLLWLVSALPLMLLLALLPLPLWVAWLLLWWFKPLHEPLLLFWLGRRLFGERPGWRELRAAWPRTVLPQLLANLTWRRLHPARSFVMPVSVLERLRGKPRSQRIRVLNRNANAAIWLTVSGFFFEFVFWLAHFLLLLMLLPQELLWITWWEYLFSPDDLSLWIRYINAFLVMSLVAPFYVAGGFALYLTRRSELEGWDIELGLRRLAQRNAGAAAGTVLALGLLLLWGMPGEPLQAAEVDRQQVRNSIEQILADETFGRERELTRWQYIERDTVEPLDMPFFDWLRAMNQELAFLGELALWLVGGGLLAYLLYRMIHRWNPALVSRSRNGRPLPTQINGLDLRPESLPSDPASEAERLIASGDYRNALSLLYRGALSTLIHQHALEIPEGATEGECRRLVASQMGQKLHECFSGLTGAWQRLAYGHRPPEREQALALCRAWRGCFGGADVQD